MNKSVSTSKIVRRTASEVLESDVFYFIRLNANQTEFHSSQLLSRAVSLALSKNRMNLKLIELIFSIRHRLFEMLESKKNLDRIVKFRSGAAFQGR